MKTEELVSGPTRRGFLESLAFAALTIRTEREKIPARSVPTFRPHPAFPVGPFSFWQKAQLHKAGSYELLFGCMERNFEGHSFQCIAAPEARVETLRALAGCRWAGAEPDETAVTVRLLLNRICYFEGPLHFVLRGWGVKDFIESPPGNTFNIALPVGVSLSLWATVHTDLPEPVEITTAFQGVLL